MLDPPDFKARWSLLAGEDGAQGVTRPTRGAFEAVAIFWLAGGF